MNDIQIPNVSYVLKTKSGRFWKISPYFEIPKDHRATLEDAKEYAKGHIQNLRSNNDEQEFFVQLWWNKEEKYKFPNDASD